VVDGAALVALRATRKPLQVESSLSAASRPTKGDDREAMFDDTDFAGAKAKAGSIRGNFQYGFYRCALPFPASLLLLWDFDRTPRK
jgi:hypothetical protein